MMMYMKVILKITNLMEKVSSFYIFIGIMYYANGDEYEGDWEEGKREGEGKMVCDCIGVMNLAEGERYEGQWSNDAMNGQGNTLPIIH